MITSTYNPYLLVTTIKDMFRMIGMQTDDTLIVRIENFSVLEEDELRKAKFTAKLKEQLFPENPLMFNSCILNQQQTGSILELWQKQQGKKLKLIDLKSTTAQQDYMEQRAWAAYIATICQPEASFDLSIAAQH